MKRFTIFAAVALAAIAGSSPGALAQSGDEMRTLNAAPMDIADGKHVAEMDCAACHNLNGISTVKGTPHIAGQRPAYLYLTLKAYKSGARSSERHEQCGQVPERRRVDQSGGLFREPRSRTAAGRAAGPAKPDPVQAGKAAAAACAGCHGDTGISQIPGIPSLVGLDPKYLVDAMKAYKNGERKNDTMKAMLAPVNERAMNNIALFYALQKPARAKTPAAGDAAAGKAAAASCGGCHGDDGVSGSPSTPSLAGQDAQYIAAALLAYKNGSRANDTMKGSCRFARRQRDEESGGLFLGAGAEGAECAQAADDRGMGRALRPLPRRQRQQHRSALPDAGRPAGRVSGEGVARLSGADAQERRDGTLWPVG